MKRDMDLVRKILIAMSENLKGPNIAWEEVIPGYTRQEILYHAFLMSEGNLIDATKSGSLSNGLPLALPISITWAGHDFLDAIKDDTLWAKAKETVIKPAGGVAFSVLLEWAKGEALRRLGLS